jgi:hypothetical protein
MVGVQELWEVVVRLEEEHFDEMQSELLILLLYRGNLSASFCHRLRVSYFRRPLRELPLSFQCIMYIVRSYVPSYGASSLMKDLSRHGLPKFENY